MKTENQENNLKFLNLLKRLEKEEEFLVRSRKNETKSKKVLTPEQQKEAFVAHCKKYRMGAILGPFKRIGNIVFKHPCKRRRKREAKKENKNMAALT